MNAIKARFSATLSSADTVVASDATPAHRRLPHHFESSGYLPATPAAVFDYLDDHTRLASHMSKSSWKMGGGRMEIKLDEGAGMSVGSKIRLAGRAFGLTLSVEELVTEREPPYHKAWETTGAPRLRVIEHYRLGFDVAPNSGGSSVRVFIDYSLPRKGIEWFCGMLFGRYYARWCTEQMVRDATSHFTSKSQRNRN